MYLNIKEVIGRLFYFKIHSYKYFEFDIVIFLSSNLRIYVNNLQRIVYGLIGCLRKQNCRRLNLKLLL